MKLVISSGRGMAFAAVWSALMAYAAPSFAQVSAGEISGRVSDESGAMIPGVTITLQGPALVRPMSAVSSSSGAYRFASLPVGTYELRFEIAGFAKLLRQDIVITAGFTAQINPRLKLSNVEETITVSGEAPIVDPRSTSLGTSYTRELLDAIPSARDPWVIIEQTPSLVMDRQNVGGNWSGQQSSFVSHGSGTNEMWNMDGATITDMAAGSSPGYYDFDSFEEIRITTGGSDASQDSGGVSINLVTKSGGNKFRGSARALVVDESMQSENITPDLRDQGAGSGNPIRRVTEWGFEVGGPIRRDKAWFWGGYSQSDIDVGVVGFLKPGCADANDKDCLRSDVTNLTNLNAKLTFQWAKAHKSSILYNSGDKLRDSRGAGSLNPPETTVRQSSPGYMAFLDHQWIPSDKLTMNLKATHVDGGFLLDFQDDSLRSVQPTFDIVSGLNGRSTTSTDNIRPTSEVRVDGNYLLSDLLGGDHVTKFGLRWRSTPFQTFTVTGGGAVARFRNGVPSEGELRRDGHTSRDMKEYSAYLNDSFKRGRFTINLGLRLDYQNDEALSANVAANPLAPELLPALDFKGADTGVEFFDISPRLGITRDLKGDGRTVLKTNLARYWGLGIDGAGTISPTGQTRLRYPWTDLNGDRVIQRNELNFSRLLFNETNYNPANPASVVSAATVDPNLENDITDEFTFGVEHELAKNFGVGLTYIFRHYWNDNATFRVGLQSASFQPVTMTVPCGNSSCDQPSYNVTYYQLPFQRPAETVLRNSQGANRRYHGLELVARKRFSNRWLMNGSFVWQSTARHYEGGPDVDFQDPTNVAQQDGYPAGTLNARWTFKLSGMAQLPWGMSASAFVNVRDGVPFNRTVATPASRTGGLGVTDVFVRGFGDERYEMFRQLDVRLDKTIRAGRTRVILGVDAFNMLNEALVLSRVASQDGRTANQIRTILAPRVIRVGARLTF